MSLFLLVGYLGLNQEKEEIKIGLTSQCAMNLKHDAPIAQTESNMQEIDMLQRIQVEDPLQMPELDINVHQEEYIKPIEELELNTKKSTQK